MNSVAFSIFGFEVAWYSIFILLGVIVGSTLFLLEAKKYEIDFLISQGVKVSAIEVKSSGTGRHESMLEFRKRYSKNIKDCYILSQKDIDQKDHLKFLPVYLTPFLG